MAKQCAFLFCSSRLPQGEFSLDELRLNIIGDFDGALRLLEEQSYDYVFVDIDDVSLRPLQVLEWLQTRESFCEKGVICDDVTSPLWERAVAFDVRHVFLSDHFQNKAKVDEHLKDWAQQKNLTREWGVQQVFHQDRNLYWIAADIKSRQIYFQVRSWLQTGLPVLLCGPQGSGKRHLTQCVSAVLWPETDCKIFDVAVCGKEKHLDELELCYQEAVRSGGAVCIHEVAFLSKTAQEFLLKWLWEPRLKVFVTTSHDLQRASQTGEFREDLALWLHRHAFDLPALRERSEDVRALTKFFLQDQEQKLGLFADAMTCLSQYEWPQGVAELKQVIEEASFSAKGKWIESRDLPNSLIQSSFYQTSSEEDVSELDYNEAKKRVLNKFHRTYMEGLIDKAQGNLTVAAERAGMDRSNFKKILKKYGIR